MQKKSKRKGPLIGAHMSIAGGVHEALLRGEKVGCKTIQIFTKNNNQWKGKPLTDEVISKFKENLESTGIWPVFAHDCYLINLCAVDKEILEKSLRATIDELERCEALGLPWLVMHPGSHLGEGEKKGIAAIAGSLNKAFKATKGFKVKVLLETTAGQGTNIGYKFEHLKEIMDKVKEPERTAVCFDTCHAFTAGYDIRKPKQYRETIDAFDQIIGLQHLLAFHVNDSKKELGSKRDRHEHIGKGFIGLSAFRNLMKDPRFKNIPKVLETPKGPDMAEDLENLAILRRLK